MENVLWLNGIAVLQMTDLNDGCADVCRSSYDEALRLSELTQARCCLHELSPAHLWPEREDGLGIGPELQIATSAGARKRSCTRSIRLSYNALLL